MALRTGHGNGAGEPRIEVLPPDELPEGVPAPARPPADRDPSGRFVKGDGTAAAARAGAQAAHEARQLARLLGLRELREDHPLAQYSRLAREWRDSHMAELGASVGGGRIGSGVASIVSTAALQLAASRWLMDIGMATGKTEHMMAASRLADASRQNILAAHELAAKEAKDRARSTGDHVPWLVNGSDDAGGADRDEQQGAADG